MQSKTRASASNAGATRFATAAALAILLTAAPQRWALVMRLRFLCRGAARPTTRRDGRRRTTGLGDWIADLDDRMTGTCR
ncbi:MAG: hypothetical protein JKP98_05270 [Rhodobacteraceae bacterium]|nr:hypothetical protein [Paracoccaceae bacterium]